MIGFLLTVLKIIGILLLVILGIIILALCLILFVPVRYSATGRIEDSYQITGKISWLLSLIRFKFSFENGDFQEAVRIFGVPLHKKAEKDLETELEEEAESEPTVTKEAPEQAIRQPAPAIEATELKEPKDSTAYSQTSPAVAGAKDTVTKEKKNLFRKWKIFWARIVRIPERIREGFLRLKRSFASKRAFWEKIKANLTDPMNQHVVKKTLGELKYLLKHFGIRKIASDLTFSLADPALTGQILGLLCIIPVLYTGDVHIYPDFEAEQLYIKGTFSVKGRVRIIRLLIVAARMILDKEVRTVLKKILHNR